jgi:hypothetical protein
MNSINVSSVIFCYCKRIDLFNKFYFTLLKINNVLYIEFVLLEKIVTNIDFGKVFTGL